MVELKYKTDFFISELVNFSAGKAVKVFTLKKNTALSRSIQRSEDVEKRAFAATGSAAYSDKLAASNRKIYAFEHFELRRSHRIRLANILTAQYAIVFARATQRTSQSSIGHNWFTLRTSTHFFPVALSVGSKAPSKQGASAQTATVAKSSGSARYGISPI